MSGVGREVESWKSSRELAKKSELEEKSCVGIDIVSWKGCQQLEEESGVGTVVWSSGREVGSWKRSRELEDKLEVGRQVRSCKRSYELEKKSGVGGELESWNTHYFSDQLFFTDQLFYFIFELYLSLLNLGTLMMSYGWEWLTCEAGFLAIFLCPILSYTKFPKYTPPSTTILVLFQWLAFRVMIGAGNVFFSSN